MKNDAFFDLLQSMEKDQFKRFQQYVRIYISKGNQALRLFEQYCQLRGSKKNGGDVVDREKVFEAFIKKEKLKAPRKHLLNLVNVVHDVLKKFLISERLEKEKPICDAVLLNIYHEKGFLNHWDIHFKKAVERLKKRPYDIEAHLELSRLYSQRYYYLGQEQTRYDSQNAMDSMFHLDEYYLSFKLKWSTELYNSKNIFGKQYEIRFLPELMEASEKLQGEFSAYQVMYLQALFLQHAPAESHYQTLKEKLYLQHEHIPKIEVAYLLNLLNNYNAVRIKNGENRLDTAFEICQKTVEFGCIDQMNAEFLLNAINLSCDKNDTATADKFFHALEQKYGSQKDAILISKARIMLSKGEYNGVIKLLKGGQQFQTPFMGIRTRILKVQAHYELGEIDLLENALRNFEDYCTRESKNPSLNLDTLNGVNRFIALLQNLCRLKPLDKKGYKGLYDDLLNSKNIVAKTWLLQKINAIYKFD